MATKKFYGDCRSGNGHFAKSKEDANPEVTADIDDNDVVTITNHKTGMVTWMPFAVYRQLKEGPPIEWVKKDGIQD